MPRAPTAHISTWANRCRGERSWGGEDSSRGEESRHGEDSCRGEELSMKSLVLIAACLMLAACAVGPDFKPPANPPAALVNAYYTDRSPLVTQSTDGLWWQQFDDPVLNELIARALETNLDLALAVDRVRAARAAFTGAELDYAPHVPATAGYAHAREQQPGFGSRRIDAESYTAGFDAAWELDLFGHVRRSVEAARGDLAAEQEDLQNVRITVAAA